MNNALAVHKSHAKQNLFHEALYLVHADASTTHLLNGLLASALRKFRFCDHLGRLLGGLNDVFKVAIAVLKDQVLSRLAILTARVVDIEHPHNMLAALQA